MLNVPILDFLQRLGLDANPFQFANADQEDRLINYFVAPPYFDSVFGDPGSPASCTVFAPRGAGKSAQRRMVELRADPEQVLCITYDEFPFASGLRPFEFTLEDHERNIGRLTTMAFLTWLGEHPERLELLNGEDRNTLHILAVSMLDSVSQSELRSSLRSLRNLSDQAKDIWNQNRWAVAAVLASINVLSGGTGAALLPEAEDPEYDIDASQSLISLGSMSAKVGLQAIYVLVDRVDETQETNANSDAAYRLIAPLIHELHLLESRPFAFKFFIPDYIEAPYRADGGRSDCVTLFHTEWHNDELVEMLNRRLDAFSQSVSSWEQISDSGSLEEMIFLSLGFAAGSPRDFIRIWGRAIDEQLRLDSTKAFISMEAMEAAVDVFCTEKARETVPADIQSVLGRLGRVDFTVSELASDVLHVQTNAARARVQSWEKAGVVAQIGELAAIHGRPHHHYGITDVRVARALLPDLDLYEFLLDKVRFCQTCGAWTLGDWEDDSAQRSEICSQCASPLTVVRHG